LPARKSFGSVGGTSGNSAWFTLHLKRAVDELVMEGFMLPKDGEDYTSAAKAKKSIGPGGDDRAASDRGQGRLEAFCSAQAVNTETFLAWRG
jgi:hypothetical protein